MSTTRDYKKTVLERAIKDPEFKQGLLKEAIKEFFKGNFAVSKELMKDYCMVKKIVL